LLLKGDDDQSDEDIDEEKGKDDKVDNVENRHLDAVVQNGTVVFLGCCHRVLQNSAHSDENDVSQVNERTES
jgi:metal-dependent hydrolase (beta-lactamase superfamily II)